MSSFTSANLTSPQSVSNSVSNIQEADSLKQLLSNEILLNTQPHTAWGAAVTAQMYLPIARDRAWQQLTDYPRWVQYFPALSQSQVLQSSEFRVSPQEIVRCKRLHQIASKNFLLFTVQAEIYLSVVETEAYRIQFHFESGNFADFAADLRLQDQGRGTLLTYWVRATPLIPVPSVFLQQAIQLDLPANLRQMRRVLCSE